MDSNTEQLKKKIIYRSNYRGTKEMDKLLGAFTNKYINKLNNDDLVNLEKLLDVDDNNLYNFYNGLNTDIKIEDNNINLLFKNFKYVESK
jgi:antitoxin CptB